MDRRAHAAPIALLAIALLAAGAPLALGGAQHDHAHPAARPADQPSAAPPSVDKFRAHHAEIRGHLAHVDEMSMAMASQGPEEQRRAARFIASFFRDHIGPHAADEERTLYPAVDRAAGLDGEPFTATMRYEHRVIDRWIDDVDRLAEAPEIDAPAFVRLTQRLLGLLEAHFGAEEDVLLPVFERGMAEGR